METLIIVILALIIGGASVYFFFNKRKANVIEKEAIILLEKVRAVCKLVTVEGSFSEIFDYQDKQSIFFGLIPQTKRALLIIQAKAFIGYDLTQIELNIDTKNKTISIANLPEPTIIGIETDIKYYDIKESTFNKFSKDDYTSLQRQAKTLVEQQIPKSELLNVSKSKGLETLKLIREITSAVGWKLVNNLINEEDEIKKLPQTTNNKIIK